MIWPKRKDAKPGDVAILRLEDGRSAVLQLLGTHPSMGEAVLVDPNLTTETVQRLPNKESSYIVFCAFSWMAQQGLVEIVSNQGPEFDVPTKTRTRRFHLSGDLGPWKEWVIFDENGDRHFPEELSADEVKIPVRSLPTFGLVVERLKSNYHPKNDVISSVL